MPRLASEAPAEVDLGAVARSSLMELSDAFRSRRLEHALQCFSAEGRVVYAGSELEELADSGDELRRLLGRVFQREEAYSWAPLTVWASAIGARHIAVFAELTGSAHGRDEVEEFPYRMSGVLVKDGDCWRWQLVHGSEPATDDSATCNR